MEASLTSALNEGCTLPIALVHPKVASTCSRASSTCSALNADGVFMLVSNVRMAFVRDLKTATTCISGPEAGAGDRMTVFCPERWGSIGGTIGGSWGHVSTDEG